MSTEIAVIKNTGRKQGEYLSITSFYGGKNAGTMLQLTQGFGSLLHCEGPGYIQLTVEDAKKLIKVLNDWLPKKFYVTLGVGQPHYPGYFIAIAKNEGEAMINTSTHLDGQRCGTYNKFSEIHPSDRIFRGTITAAGIELAE